MHACDQALRALITFLVQTACARGVKLQVRPVRVVDYKGRESDLTSVARMSGEIEALVQKECFYGG